MSCRRASLWLLALWPLSLLLEVKAQASQCGPVDENATDSGGDGCSYYGQYPYFCGCCDTPAFSASDCCECQGPPMDGNATWWARIFHSWPRKATALCLPSKLRGTEMALPADIAERLPNLQEIDLDSNNLVGNLPPQLGELSQLRRLNLSFNELSGQLPPELGNLSALQWLNLKGNQLSGRLPPELGNLSSLEGLQLDNNRFNGGLPPSLASLQRLRHFWASGNAELCGDATVLEELESLENLSLSQCCFEDWHLPGLPRKLAFLDLSSNRLSRIPRRWQTQGQSLTDILLNHNRISQWDTSSIVPLSQVGTCGYRPSGQRLTWPLLRRLELSDNPLSLPAYDFLESLAHLSQLLLLTVRCANLTGPVPHMASEALVPAYPHRGNADCSGLPGPQASFSALEDLDLAGNSITSLLASPSRHLVTANFSRNALVAASAPWATEVEGTVDARGNPDLHFSVRLDPGGLCPDVAIDLVANPHGWSRTSDGRAECTTLCRLPFTNLLMDVTVNSSILCRCSQGQGVGLDCTSCPDDTYSISSFEHGYYSRSCLACPANSGLPGGQGLCFADCRCTAGSYMAQIDNGSALDVGTTPCSRLAPEGRCLSCGLFKTSLPGSRKAADCFCNSNESDGRGWRGLLERKGRCGCPEGSHMSFADRSCQPCQSEEDCGDWTRSLVPPTVKPGYWATPPPPEGSDGMFGNFSHHSIWRCQSSKTCIGGSACGENRTGRACSLCKQGHFLTPTGSCAPCRQSHTKARGVLTGLLLACMVMPVAVHFHLKSNRGEPQGIALTLRSVYVSVKQLLKFVQILALVSVFRVEWPPAAEDAFAVTRAFSLGFAAWAGVACLDAQQQHSMTLEVAFRWMLPFAGIVLTCLAALLLSLCGLLLDSSCSRCCQTREGRVRQLLSFQLMDIVRVLVFFLNLLFPSLLRNALLPLTCVPSPNGLMTMSSFPHVVCGDWRWSAGPDDGEDFWTVALAGLVQSAILSIGFPLVLFFAWNRIKTTETRGATPRHSVLERRRRWWAFLFVDFRQRKMHWALVAVSRDIVLNLVVVLLPGFGTAQLLLTSVVCIAYACQAFCTSPYPDASNSLLETSTSAGIAVLCILSAGMGFQSEPDVLDVGAVIAGGRSGPGYFRRTIALVSAQALAFLVPLAILALQLLMVFPVSRRLVPSGLRPLTSEERGEWSQRFARAMRIRGGPLPGVVAEFDSVDFSFFQRAVTCASTVRKGMSTSTHSRRDDLCIKQAEKTEEEDRHDDLCIEQAEKKEEEDRHDMGTHTETAALQTEIVAVRKENTELKDAFRQREDAFCQCEDAFRQREEALQIEIEQLRRQLQVKAKTISMAL